MFPARIPALYLEYADARIPSLFRKRNVGRRVSAAPPSHSRLPSSAPPTEALALGRHLLNFGLVLEAVAEHYQPNFLWNYPYEPAKHFTAFYRNRPPLKSEAAQRASRLVLCELTARVLKQGPQALGIETLEQM